MIYHLIKSLDTTFTPIKIVNDSVKQAESMARRIVNTECRDGLTLDNFEFKTIAIYSVIKNSNYEQGVDSIDKKYTRKYIKSISYMK
jgi:hypothetical protein